MLTVSETAALLRTFDNVLILTHVRPDGDTVGCAAALCAGLRALGKTAYLLPNPELTKWQDDFHACMVEQYPDLERGESASKTGRKQMIRSSPK